MQWQDVYVEDLLHRNPGNASTLAPAEAAFAPLVRAWVAAEPGACARAGGAAEGPPSAAGGTLSGAADGAAGGSFTRVVVSSLKPEILRQIADEEGGQQLLPARPLAQAPLQPLAHGSACLPGRAQAHRRAAHLLHDSSCVV